eukprot:scaffold298837_cov23-Tisochrysis_lutea.AAC.1
MAIMVTRVTMHYAPTCCTHHALCSHLLRALCAVFPIAVEGARCMLRMFRGAIGDPFIPLPAQEGHACLCADMYNGSEVYMREKPSFRMHGCQARLPLYTYICIP